MTVIVKSKICIVTSVHPVFDTRIFHKQALSLAAAGYEVVLVGPHDKKETVKGVTLVPLPKPKTRLSRVGGLFGVFKLARRQEADVYHFHDPELLLVGPWLRLTMPTKLIIDIHENVKKQIADKHWIAKPLRRILGSVYGVIELICLRFFDGVILAEDSYLPHYRKHRNVICVHNYSLIVEPPSGKTGPLSRAVYVGGLSRERGILELVSAMKLLRSTYDVRLSLAGPIYSQEFRGALEAAITDAGLKEAVERHDRVEFSDAQRLISSADIGLACLHPIPNYIGSLTTKMFEYMGAGLPVVVSNFPLWEEIVRESHCGLTVNALDPKDIARAVAWLIDHPDEAREMGANGRQAVLRKYNWGAEKDRLILFYEEILKL